MTFFVGYVFSASVDARRGRMMNDATVKKIHYTFILFIELFFCRRGKCCDLIGYNHREFNHHSGLSTNHTHTLVSTSHVCPFTRPHVFFLASILLQSLLPSVPRPPMFTPVLRHEDSFAYDSTRSQQR